MHGALIGRDRCIHEPIGSRVVFPSGESDLLTPSTSSGWLVQRPERDICLSPDPSSLFYVLS